MSLEQERMRVLSMIEKGQVTAAEGARLLDALSGVGRPRPHTDAPSVPRLRVPRRLRVRVTDLDTGQQKVDINMPWSLVGVGRALGARFTPPEVDIDFDEVMRRLDSGGEGRIMDVVDEEDRERVEIYVE